MITRQYKYQMKGFEELSSVLILPPPATYFMTYGINLFSFVFYVLST